MVFVVKNDNNNINFYKIVSLFMECFLFGYFLGVSFSWVSWVIRVKDCVFYIK